MHGSPPEPWTTSSAGPFVTIKPGGPLRGSVTISVAPADAEHPLRIDARWMPPGTDALAVAGGWPLPRRPPAGSRMG